MRDSLDLCLSCKACSADCPAGVDMARYKSEVAYRAYRRRLRPRSHYALGQLPALGPAGRRRAPAGQRAAADQAAGHGGPRRAAGWTPGARSRPSPRCRSAAPPARRSAAVAPRAPGSRARPERPVVLWADSFSDAFDPGVPQAALTVLGQAGYQAIVPERPACCGLTWISTGQLDGARRRLGALLGRPRPVRGGRDPHRRAGALLHRRAPVRPGGPVPRRRPGRGGGRRHPHAGRAAHRTAPARPRAAVGAARTWPAPRSSPSRTATTTR